MYKKKKNRFLIIIIFLLIVIIAAGFGVYKFKFADKENSQVEEEIVLEKNQELIYLTITKILGNEMTAYTTNGDSEKTSIWMIPVGTEVVTKLGTSTTFSRLAAGDNIKAVVENVNAGQEIIKIWIEN